MRLFDVRAYCINVYQLCANICNAKMTEKIMNFKVLLYSNVRNRQEESSTDRFVWFLPNAIPPTKINPQLISFLTSRDFSKKPLNFDERLRKFTLFEDKAQVFIFAVLAGSELNENQGYMPGFYSTLKCLGTIIPYGDLLYLPMLIDENTVINPMNHKDIPWLQKDPNKSAFFVTVLAHYLHKNEENSFIARRRIYVEDIIGNNELIRLFLCGNDVDFQIVGKLQSRDLKAISILRRIYKNENEAMTDEATQYLPSDFGSSATSGNLGNLYFWKLYQSTFDKESN